MEPIVDKTEAKDLEKYHQFYLQLLSFEEEKHKQNQEKIRIGIKFLFWVPLVFLALMFLTDSSKVIFLVLWIASLFGIAAYLIYAEYSDFELQEKIRRYKESEDEEDEYLIGGEIEALEETLTEIARILDEKKLQNKEKLLEAIRQRRSK